MKMIEDCCSKGDCMKLWFVSMECAGIAEAGGVKNVTYSLCKEFSELGHDVTLFIPVFKCNSWYLLTEVQELTFTVNVSLCNKNESVKYTKAVCKKGNFDVVLIQHPSFSEKEGVYTYTENEQKLNPECKKGEGHKDLLFKDILFQKSVAAYLSKIKTDDYPQIIHCQDASTAVLPAFVNELRINTCPAYVVTIHNAGPYYHHEFKNLEEAFWYTELDKNLLGSAMNGERVEPFLLAVESGAKLTTVSEVYAKELMDPCNADITDGLSPVFYAKHVVIKGITNGFDYERYNPEDKNVSKLPYEFSPEKGELEGKYKSRKVFMNEISDNKDFSAPGIKKYGFLMADETCRKEIFIAYHGRVTTQKGITVLADAIPEILKKNPYVRFVVAGQGETRLEENLVKLTEDYPGKIIYMNGYNQAVVRLVTAMCDFIVLPSFFEPCGLEDFIAQTYGTLPIAHKTGGLNKIADGKTGFLYEKNTSEILANKILQVADIMKANPDAILKMVQDGAASVHTRYLWKNVIKNDYLKFFKEILKNFNFTY